MVPCSAGLLPTSHGFQSRSRQTVHFRIGMGPFPRQCVRIEAANELGHLLEFQEARTRWNQKPQRELDGTDLADQVQLPQSREKIDIAFPRGPREKSDECRIQKQ